MSSSFPEPLEFNPRANSSRVLLILGLFLVIIVVILKVFFEDDIRKLLLGSDESSEDLNDFKEVYNIGKNIYTYDQAHKVCDSLNAKLAAHDQVVNAYKNGAEWCNYGWSKGQNALFPIQKGTWEEIQTRPENYRNECGTKYGVNGGFFENSNLRFGVNCYGVKPEGKIAEDYKISSYETQVKHLKELSKEALDKLGIKPFNQDKWSKYN